MHKVCEREGWNSPGSTALEKQIYRLEKGQVLHPDEFYTRLYCLVYDKTKQELFGDIEPTPTEDTKDRFKLRSHKFIPAYIGKDAYDKLIESVTFESDVKQWFECASTDIETDSGNCRLYVWPFGVAIFYLVEVCEMKSLAELSLWRKASYDENRDWADSKLRYLTQDDDIRTSYVLSFYWLDRSIWRSPRLETSMRILSIPEVLQEREDQASDTELAQAMNIERSLIREGFDNREIIDFGMRGISLGYASWSGVSYHPIAPMRSLTENEIADCELAVQAMWVYCEHIRDQVESGQDPVVPTEYSWRFLRGARSRLINERPTETSQHRSMREAIMQTSGLDRHLAQAVEVLRESER